MTKPRFYKMPIHVLAITATTWVARLYYE